MNQPSFKQYMRVWMFALAMATLGAACGGKPSKPANVPKPPVDENLAQLVPDGVDAVFRIDMAGLRSSSFFGSVGAIVTEPGLMPIVDASGFNPMLQSTEILFAYSGGTGEDKQEQGVMIAKGDFAAKDVVAKLGAQPGAVLEAMGGMPGAKSPTFHVVALTDRTLAVGTPEMVSRVVDLVTHQGAALPPRPFSSIALQPGQVAVFQYQKGASTPTIPSLGGRRPPVDMRDVVSAKGELRTDAGFALALTVEAVTPKDAADMVKSLQKLKGNLSKNMLTVLLGLDWFFQRISLKAEQTTVDIVISLTGADVEELKKLADKIQKMRELLGDQEGAGLKLEVPQ